MAKNGQQAKISIGNEASQPLLATAAGTLVPMVLLDYPAENIPKSTVITIREVPLVETCDEYTQHVKAALTAAWVYSERKINQVDWLFGPLALCVEMMANVELSVTNTILKAIAITQNSNAAPTNVQVATSRAVFGFGGFIFFFNLLLTVKNKQNKYLLCSFTSQTRDKISSALIKTSTIASTFGLTATTAAFIYVYKNMRGLSSFLSLTIGLSIATSLAHWFVYRQTIFPASTQAQYQSYTHTRTAPNFCLSETANGVLRKAATVLSEVGRFAGLGRIMGRIVEIFSDPSAEKKALTDKTNVALITSFAFAGLVCVALKPYFPKTIYRVHQFSIFLKTAIFAYLMTDDCIGNNKPSFFLENSPLPLTAVLIFFTFLGIVQSNRYTQRAEDKNDITPLSPAASSIASSTDSGEPFDDSPNSSFELEAQDSPTHQPDDDEATIPYSPLANA